MPEDPYHPEPPYGCETRFEAADIVGFDAENELVAGPECGFNLWNLTTP